jgi:SNF2 family DNA or RNA helicase
MRQQSLFDLLRPAPKPEAQPEPAPRPVIPPRVEPVVPKPPAPALVLTPPAAEPAPEPRPPTTQDVQRVAPVHPDAKPHPTLMDCIESLAGQCDGARTKDEVGFAGPDAMWGKMLAMSGNDRDWTDDERRAAWERLRKYKGQLARNGIDFDAIPVPPPMDRPDDRPRRQAATTTTTSTPEDGPGVWRWIDGHAVFIPEHERQSYDKADMSASTVTAFPGHIGLHFKYDPRLVALVKTVRGARWNPITKSWSVPMERFQEVIDLANVDMTQKAMAAWQEHQERAVAREQAQAEANALLSEADRGFTQDILMLTPEQLAQVDTLDNWTRGTFLPSNLGKSRDRLSPKQLRIVDRAQEELDNWLNANPHQRAMFAQAWRDREGQLKAAAQAKTNELDALSHDQDISNFQMPAGFNPAVLTGGELYPHQKQGVAWLMRAKAGILAFATALGKTNTAVTAAAKLQEEGKAKRCLFVVPSARKIGTIRDIKALFPGKKVVLVDGTPAERARQYRDAETADFVVAGYGLIQREPEKLHGSGFDIVINDEAVRLKGKSSQTAKNSKEFFSAPYTWDLSATPIPNSPEDLYQLMQRLQPTLFGSRAQFLRQHCRTDRVYAQGRMITRITGYQNLAYTRSVVAPYILARTWQSPDVQIPMPERRNARQTLDLHPAQSVYYEAARTGALEALKRVNNPGQMTREERANILTNILRMEQVAITPELVDPSYKGEAPKVAEAVQMVKDHFGAGHTKACVIYSHYLPVIDILQRELQKEGLTNGDIATIKGGMTPEKIQDIVDGINTGKHKVLIASDAAAEGLNLQHNSQMLLHMDTPWRPDILEQREGRIYRPGQTADVVMMRLMTNTSVEQHKDNLVKRKAGAQRAIVHGESPADDPEMSYEDFLALVGATDSEKRGMRHAA